MLIAISSPEGKGAKEWEALLPGADPSEAEMKPPLFTAQAAKSHFQAAGRAPMTIMLEADSVETWGKRKAFIGSLHRFKIAPSARFEEESMLPSRNAPEGELICRKSAGKAVEDARPRVEAARGRICDEESIDAHGNWSYLAAWGLKLQGSQRPSKALDIRRAKTVSKRPLLILEYDRRQSTQAMLGLVDFHANEMKPEVKMAWLSSLLGLAHKALEAKSRLDDEQA